ncbi:unnamed protein product [Camellia sinensis]
MTIGVPAHHPTLSPPPPSSFSSLNLPSFAQQFGGLPRNSVNVPESVSLSLSLSQLRRVLETLTMADQSAAVDLIPPNPNPTIIVSLNIVRRWVRWKEGEFRSHTRRYIAVNTDPSKNSDQLMESMRLGLIS